MFDGSGKFRFQDNRIVRFRPLYGLMQKTQTTYSGDVVGELTVLAERYMEQGRHSDAEHMLQLVRSINPLNE